ncbi:hypothetical protein IMZ48_20260 [Candidatus Bathyarchaeota archaeon]|nr:hypothetical protein [Candidatus Bathyarchaeota archaeon]
MMALKKRGQVGIVLFGVSKEEVYQIERLGGFQKGNNSKTFTTKERINESTETAAPENPPRGGICKTLIIKHHANPK